MKKKINRSGQQQKTEWSSNDQTNTGTDSNISEPIRRENTILQQGQNQCFPKPQ